MNESLKTELEPPALVVPASIDAIINDFDGRDEPFSSMDVYSALCTARQNLKEPSPEENTGAWAEVLAFGLAATEHNEKPWGTYFGPMGSGTRNDGEVVYFPDVRRADAAILDHWKQRARSVSNAVLCARYNDLVWDLSQLIANEKRDVEYARRAIDAYLTAARQNGRDAHDAFPEAERALALSLQIGDAAQRDAARGAVLTLHALAVANNGMWWKAYDALEEQPKSGMTEAERDSLIADLESVLANAADSSDPSKFNPHDVESAANKLITHYRRTGQNDEIQRLQITIAKAFEHFGSMANAMLASDVLQTSMDAYRAAGMKDDEARILRLIEKANVESAAHMTTHEFKQEIPNEVVEEFLSKIVMETKDETFHRIAGEFLTVRSEMEQSLKESAKSSPLAAMIPRTMLKGDRVVARIGSLDEDPIGHLIDQANTHLSLNTPWLGWSVAHAQKKHSLSAEDIAVWVNRAGLFIDGLLLREGITAWIGGDHVKAAHILVPQVEAGFRTLTGRCGRPTTKAHPQMNQARMVITMGEILFNEETSQSLGPHGPDIVLHFRALYADPRGHNLRNDLAHGLVSLESLNAGIMLWVIHSLLLLGAWLEPEGAPESESEPVLSEPAAKD